MKNKETIQQMQDIMKVFTSMKPEEAMCKADDIVSENKPKEALNKNVVSGAFLPKDAKDFTNLSLKEIVQKVEKMEAEVFEGNDFAIIKVNRDKSQTESKPDEKTCLSYQLLQTAKYFADVFDADIDSEFVKCASREFVKALRLRDKYTSERFAKPITDLYAFIIAHFVSSSAKPEPSKPSVIAKCDTYAETMIHMIKNLSIDHDYYGTRELRDDEDLITQMKLLFNRGPSFIEIMISLEEELEKHMNGLKTLGGYTTLRNVIEDVINPILDVSPLDSLQALHEFLTEEEDGEESVIGHDLLIVANLPYHFARLMLDLTDKDNRDELKRLKWSVRSRISDKKPDTCTCKKCGCKK